MRIDGAPRETVCPRTSSRVAAAAVLVGPSVPRSVLVERATTTRRKGNRREISVKREGHRAECRGRGRSPPSQEKKSEARRQLARRTDRRTNADAGGRSLLRWAKEAFDYIPTAKSRLVARALPYPCRNLKSIHSLLPDIGVYLILFMSLPICGRKYFDRKYSKDGPPRH